jgi:hypothetical protein
MRLIPRMGACLPTYRRPMPICLCRNDASFLAGREVGRQLMFQRHADTRERACHNPSSLPHPVAQAQDDGAHLLKEEVKSKVNFAQLPTSTPPMLRRPPRHAQYVKDLPLALRLQQPALCNPLPPLAAHDIRKQSALIQAHSLLAG